MKVVTVLFLLVFIVFFLFTGVWVLQEPKCKTASPKERLEMRCQKALYEYRG